MASAALKDPADEKAEAKWRWVCGMICVVAVALIWICASFVVQHVVDTGVSPFLITYICNSLFVIYIPIVEARRYFDRLAKDHGWGTNVYGKLVNESEALAELPQVLGSPLEKLHGSSGRSVAEKESSSEQEEQDVEHVANAGETDGDAMAEEFSSRPWTRKRTALVGLMICPFWFLAQLTFNLSLKYTTVTSNTILSTTSSLFTFLVSLQFLGEKFTWLKLGSIAFCMAGTIFVSLGDSWKGANEVAPMPLFGDVICLLSAMFYAIYTALIRVKIPDEEDRKGNVSTALIFGYIGLFNALLLAPVALVLHLTGIEPFHRLTLSQVVLIIAKGLLDNVLSDYLWARAVLLTTPTAATAGLTIQVPIAAVVDSIRGTIPSFLDVVGGVAVLIGFFGINQPDSSQLPSHEELAESVDVDLPPNDSLATRSGN